MAGESRAFGDLRRRFPDAPPDLRVGVEELLDDAGEGADVADRVVLRDLRADEVRGLSNVVGRFAELRADRHAGDCIESAVGQ